MKLIAALVLVGLPIYAWAKFQPSEPEPTNDNPETLPEQNFLESTGIMTGQKTRGERNNNPGNIRKSAAAWLGKIPGSDSAFETFSSPEYGIRAMKITLRNYQTMHGLRTVKEIISRWAPSTENNTAAYVRNVAAAMGVTPTQQINLNDQGTMAALVSAIIAHENGRNVYSLAQIAGGLSLA
jgi:hypothetical protein